MLCSLVNARQCRALTSHPPPHATGCAQGQGANDVPLLAAAASKVEGAVRLLEDMSRNIVTAIAAESKRWVHACRRASKCQGEVMVMKFYRR